MRSSVADYLIDFERLGHEHAYAERTGYRTARCTYREVAETAFRFARELTARRIRKGDRVMLWGPNSAAWIAAFFGCAHRGVIAVPMDHAASSDFALRVFQQVYGQLLVCSRDHVQSGLPTIVLEELRDSLNRHSSASLASEKIGRDDALESVPTLCFPRGIRITVLCFCWSRIFFDRC